LFQLLQPERRMTSETALPNARMAEDWNEQVGKTWAMLHRRLDKQIAPIGAAAMAKAGFAPGQSVLDIGCGCGETTFEIAARIAPGRVLGADISATLLAIAREDAAAKGLANADFVETDAQTHGFKPEYDIVFSRFGVMFFEDPAAAFANIRTALKPGGRLAFCCWRAPAENVWLSLPMQAAGHLLPPLPPSDPTAPGPFAFADGARVRRILEGAGFKDVRVDPLDLRIGSEGLEDTVFTSLRMGPLGAALRQTGADDELKAKVEAAIREGLRPHLVDGVVTLPAAVWIVSAKAP
jgi:SAM-dependent methyltransferase